MTLYRQLCLCNTHTHRLYSWKSELLFCPRKIMACFLICTRIYVTVAVYLSWPSAINFDIYGFLTSLSWGRESEHVFCLVCLESHPVVYLSSESANGLCWEVDLWSVLRERESTCVLSVSRESTNGLSVCPEGQPMVCTEKQTMVLRERERESQPVFCLSRESTSGSVCPESQSMVFLSRRWTYHLRSVLRERESTLVVYIESRPMVCLSRESTYGPRVSLWSWSVKRESQPMVCLESWPMVLVSQTANL